MKYQFLIYCLFFSLGLYAQQPYAWNLSVEDGLPSSEVYDLFEDSKGYMWIGTDKGLCKYNGQTFQYYKNKDQKGEALSGIQEDEKGRIWVRNFKNQIFYAEGDSLHRLEVMDSLDLTSLKEFLVGTAQTFYIFDNLKKVIFCLKKTVSGWKVNEIDLTTLGGDDLYLVFHQIALDQIGDLYLLTSTGLYKLEDNKLRFVTTKNLGKRSYFDQKIIASSKNILFTETDDLILQVMDAEEYQLSRIKKGKVTEIDSLEHRIYLKTKNLLFVRHLKDNSTWILTSNGGAVEVLSDRINSVDRGQILFPNEGISDILIDREGNYWFSSLRNGVYMIPQWSLVQTKETKFGIREGMLNIMEKKDSLSFFLGSSDKKVLLLNSKQKIEQIYNVPIGRCNHLFWNGKELSISGERYHLIFKKKSSIHHRGNSSTSDMKNSYIYNKNIILTSNGIVGLSMIMNTQQEVGIDSFPEKKFPSIPEYNSYRVGLGRVAYTKNVRNKLCNWVIGIEEKHRFLAAYSDTLMCYPEKGMNYPVLGPKGETIRGTFMEKGRDNLIWVCTVNSGTYGLDENLQVKYHFTKEDGLINNTIKRVRINEAGQLWLLTSQGVQAFDPETKESHVYTIQDGLPTHEIRDLILLDGKVWLSTEKGLVSFDQNMSSKNEVAPLVYIKGVSIHDKDTFLNTSYDLTYEQNGLTIWVEGLAYRSRGNFKYKYRMLGIDSLWRYQDGQIDFMRFPQLQSGQYTFEVKAVNEDGVESTEAAVVVFNIAPPYWKTWWFRSIILLLILFVIIMIVRVQLRQARLESQNSNLKMEALQSQMNPHFIFNVLTAVQNLWLQQKNELAMDLQSNFAQLLRKIFQYSSKRAISIERVEEFLNNYLNLEQIRFEHQVDIRFEIEEELLDDEYFIPPLLIQPVIENSFKHGLFHKLGDRKLNIILKAEGVYLYCCVEDNGVGRKVNTTHKKIRRSSGLSTTKDRLAILQQNVIKKVHPYNNLKITDLKSTNGTPIGTKVELWIPFIKN